MKILELSSIIRRKRTCYTARTLKEYVAENILKRDFPANTYNEKWLTDVIEFKYTVLDKAYLGAIFDLGNKYVISWVL